MDDVHAKRKFQSGRDGPHKAPKLARGGDRVTGTMSFAERMMAKMGYKEGQGLGKDGEGMVNPIEVKLRPQGAGVGAVREKTEQYKQEQRRAAEKRGEEYEGSSEDERRARRERKNRTQVMGATSGGANAPGRLRKERTKYKTMADVQAVAPGLDVPPQMLSSIIDATGTQTRLLTSAAGLMTPTGQPSDSEADKIAKRERLEFEAFVDAWHGIQEQKVYTEEHSGQHQMELENMDDELHKLQTVIEATEKLRLASAGDTDMAGEWPAILSRVEEFQKAEAHNISKFSLSDAVVGAICPHFKNQIAGWDPLSQPAFLVADLSRIRAGLGLQSQHSVVLSKDGEVSNEHLAGRRHPQSTTSYETMMYTVWLPKIRTATTAWSVLDPQPLTTLVSSWSTLLPDFIHSHVIDQLVVPKLEAALETWDPRKRAHHHKHVTVRHSQPHIWIFPWLPFLPSYQLDPKASSGLLYNLRRRLRQVLDGWNIASGILHGLLEWRDLLHSELEHILVRHLLPRLARYISQNFEVNPSDQDLTPIQNVFKWVSHFKTEVFARLLVAEFFPKWHSVLYSWLTDGEANFEEIGQWFAWWKDRIPESIRAHRDVAKEFEKGADMIGKTADLVEQDRPLTELAAPAAGPARPISREIGKKLDAKASSRGVAAREISESFKDVVEAWCTDEDLTLIPLRDAHAQTGAPLFRITASATGRGGVIVYIKGDIVWAQKKGDRATFEPIELGDGLVQRAEGR